MAGKGMGGGRKGAGTRGLASQSCAPSGRAGWGRVSSPLVGESCRVRGYQQTAAANDVDPRGLPSGDSGSMAEMVMPPIRLKHSPTNGEDQSLRSVSCPRGPFS